MRRLLFGCLLGACAAAGAAAEVPTNHVGAAEAATNRVHAGNTSTNGVRNPFWPMGYEGEREVIAPGVHTRPKPVAPAKGARPGRVLTAAEKAAQEAAEKAAKEAAEKAAAEKAAKEAAARAEAERKKREVTDVHWSAARAALACGGRRKFREEDELQNTSVVINGKVYSNGDLVSFTHDSRRFTWRYEGLTDQNKLKLTQVRAKYLEKPGEAGKKSDKGANP